MHEEVLDNLESIHGALLRMNRSIQAEGTFGIIKYDRWYKRIVRRVVWTDELPLFIRLEVYSPERIIVITFILCFLLIHREFHELFHPMLLAEKIIKGYTEKLKEYVVKLKTCGTDRNSYSKTDHDATFMRMNIGNFMNFSIPCSWQKR